MLTHETPAKDRFLSLLDHRAPACVTIALESSPSPREHERIRIALRDAIDSAEQQLRERAIPKEVERAVIEPLRALLTDEEFWSSQANALAVLAAPDLLEAYRLPSLARDVVAVSDRFQTAPLLVAATDDESLFVLQLAERTARLTRIGPDDTVTEHTLTLPGDHELMLGQAENHGRSDRDRAQGANGDRTERERYARVVEEEVAKVVPTHARFVLSASADLDPAYRAVNTRDGLLEASIDAHPGSLDDRALVERARHLVDDVRDRETSAWKERFGTLRAQGLATSRIAEVAAAAAEAAIEELRFDREADATGAVDEYGRVDRADQETPLVEEIAARVLHSGGRVRAVRRRDLVDGSPVAATLRFPVSVSR